MDYTAMGAVNITATKSKTLGEDSVESILRSLDTIRGKTADCLMKVKAIDEALYGGAPQQASDTANMPASPGMMGSAAEYCRNINEELDRLYDTISRLSNNLGGPF